MKTTVLAPLLLLCLLSIFFQETDAVCSGCGCNIFCCDCDFGCLEGGCDDCCQLAMTQEDSVKDCCNEKTVGNITYTLVPGLPDMETHPKSAKDGCIYTVKGDPSGDKFAFARGNLPVECKDENPVGITAGSSISTTDKAAQPVETVVTFEENGESFEQKDSYNPDTKEAVLAVPAHGNYPATTFIMQGRSSNSPVAGKMIVSTETACSLEDLPDEINPEDMTTETRKRKDVRQTNEVKIYQIRSDTREMTAEEKLGLSESMKNECAGKTVVTSSIETISQEEFLAKTDFSTSFNRSLQRVNNNDILQKNSRQGCANLYYGCALADQQSHCVRWSYVGFDYESTGDQPLIHMLGGTENYCMRCCRDADSVYPQCSCINNQQRFSTAFAISEYWTGSQVYECIKRSYYCKWSQDNTISQCNYAGSGSCVHDSTTCPCREPTQALCKANEE